MKLAQSFHRIVIAFAVVAIAQPAWADPKEADGHFRHGVELFKDNDYSAALIEFKRAYELDPKYQVLYNIGEAYFQLQDYANALRTLQRYLNEGGAKITASRRTDVEHDLEKLKKRVARLEVLTSEPGAKVVIDDAEVGTTPLDEALLVSAGRRKVTATIAGRPPATQVVDLAGGDTRSITLTIPKIEAQKVELMMPVAQSSGPSVPIWPWAVTGALATGAVVTGILALGASGDLKDKLAAFPGDPSAISSAHDKTTTLALTTDILVGATAVMGGVSLWLTLREPSASPDQRSARVVVGPGSLGLAGSF